MKRILLITAFLFSYVFVQAQPEKLTLFFKLSDYFLKRHVYKGLVNYKYSRDNSREIDLLQKTIAEIDLSSASDSERKAFMINAYNLLVIYQVTQNYPLAKPLDKEGFFDVTTFAIAGEQLTLNQLESKMIAEFKDPRFHFVLACAAMSCPKLYNLAYKPDNLEQLMEERTSLALNDKDFTRVNASTNQISLCKIFEWYKKDFEMEGTTIEFVNKYLDSKISTNYRVSYYEYDWTLNERKGK